MQNWTFLPFPRHNQSTSSRFALTHDTVIWLGVDQPQGFLFAAEKLQRAAAGQTGLKLAIISNVDEPVSPARIMFRSCPHEINHPQGYRLDITNQAVTITANDPAGGYYAVCTLVQILEQIPVGERALPGVEILDWPDFLVRGVMLDISRDKVYRMDTLYEVVERLSGWKINQLQLYTEHTFAYHNHPAVWQDASPMTGEEITALDAFCRQRYIELVPNQNSFGHMERWLKLEPYAALAETHGEFVTSWGETKIGPYSLAPLEPGSTTLIGSLYDELTPYFSSQMINVGCDETFDLGKGKSLAACERHGVGRVYLEFVLKIYELVKQRGKTMQFWGDIILKYPEYLAEIPRDVIGLIWGYEANHPFDRQAGQFAAAGIPFYVCPGNSVWNSLAGRTDNTLGNLKNAAVHGLKHGAIGYLTTDWGDNGHWQTWPISFLGLAAGAEMSWCGATNIDPPIQPMLSRYVFDDPAGVMGHLAYDLGNADHAEHMLMPGAEGYFWPLQLSLEDIRSKRNYRPEMFINGLSRLKTIRERYLGMDKMQRSDAELIRREFGLTIRMMEHACRRGLYAFGQAEVSVEALAADLVEIIEEYRWVWLQRNRPGGLKDSLARLQKLETDYERALSIGH